MTAEVDAIRALVLREARLLDEGRFKDWVALYTRDCAYWMPVDPAATDPATSVAHFHDDHQLMTARAHRLEVPRVNAPEPPPRTLHLLSDIEVEITGAEAVARAAQIYVEWRMRGYGEDDQRMLAGRVTWTLAWAGEGWQIRRKRIDLINSEASLNAIAIPL